MCHLLFFPSPSLLLVILPLNLAPAPSPPHLQVRRLHAAHERSAVAEVTRRHLRPQTHSCRRKPLGIIRQSHRALHVVVCIDGDEIRHPAHRVEQRRSHVVRVAFTNRGQHRDSHPQRLARRRGPGVWERVQRHVNHAVHGQVRAGASHEREQVDAPRLNAQLFHRAEKPSLNRLARKRLILEEQAGVRDGSHDPSPRVSNVGSDLGEGVEAPEGDVAAAQARRGCHRASLRTGRITQETPRQPSQVFGERLSGINRVAHGVGDAIIDRG